MIKSTRDVAVLPTIQEEEAKAPEYIKADRSSSAFSKLTRNLALSALMLIGIVSVRNAQLPSEQTLLTAAQSLIMDSSWDETLGRINFVGNFLPETMAVFFDASENHQLAAPCSGTLVHSWSNDAPYLCYEAQESTVQAMADGQVMSLAHGLEEEIILRVRQADGLEALYYNMDATTLREGDVIARGQTLGSIMPGKYALVEVRKDGMPVNPTSWLQCSSEIGNP